MHTVQARGILSAEKCMNVYRGCTHGCIYCDSRSVCYGMDHPFEDVAVKENAPELLDRVLRGKKRRCMIHTGAMCDPYLPLEAQCRLTRRCSEIIARRGFGLSIQTKSDGILEDLDLLQRIARQSKCVAQMTLTTCDEKLCKILEPGVCGTRRRARALKQMTQAGIETVAWISPILPFLNDTEENLRGLLEHGRYPAGRQPGVFLSGPGSAFSGPEAGIRPAIRPGLRMRQPGRARGSWKFSTANAKSGA